MLRMIDLLYVLVVDRPPCDKAQHCRISANGCTLASTYLKEHASCTPPSQSRPAWCSLPPLPMRSRPRTGQNSRAVGPPCARWIAPAAMGAITTDGLHHR